MKSKISKLLILVLPILLLFTGCNDSKTKDSNSSNDKLTIVTSFYPLYISTLNIIKGVDDVELVNMTKPQTGCLHDYELVPLDLKTLSTADIFVANGAGMESFLDKILTQYPDINIIDSSNGIDLISESHDEDEDHDHEDDEEQDDDHDHDHDVNPHVWVSISKNIEQVQNIADALSAADSKNSDKYQSNAKEYIAKLEALSTEMHAELDSLPNRDIVTFHEAFPYFAEEFNLNIVGVIEVEPDSEPSAKEVENVIETIKEHNVKSLFAEPQYSSKIADTIAKETNTKVYILDPIVTGEANENAYDDYINKMKENLTTLKEALK